MKMLCEDTQQKKLKMYIPNKQAKYVCEKKELTEHGCELGLDWM
jgi:hypothetical protein